MSSACVCHLNKWCFYCEMYSPLEKKMEAYKNLSELQDKLLISYRIGKNPGSLLDKLSAARNKIVKLEMEEVLRDETDNTRKASTSRQNDTTQ